MTLNPPALLLPGKGTIFTAAPNTAPPAKATVDPTNATTHADWTCLGHTSRENTVSFDIDGGDSNVIGSWWDDKLRNSAEPTNLSISASSLQLDAVTLQLAFPNGEIRNGGYAGPAKIEPIDKAWYVLMVDGTTRAGIYLPRVSTKISDAPELDIEKFFEIRIGGPLLSATAQVKVNTTTIVEIGQPFWIDPPVALTAP